MHSLRRGDRVTLRTEVVRLALVPTATQITVPQVLAKLDAEFAPVAHAVAAGEFALWVGSGLSRKAPDLGDLLETGIEYLRAGAADPARSARFTPALEEALGHAGVAMGALAGRYGTSFPAWPERDAIIGALWTKYSRVLDIRVPGEPGDFVLWTAIDIRAAFAHPRPPAAEHLCIAMLVMEGAVRSIASANWDGFIEAAIDRLSGGAPGMLQVVVDPDQLRGSPGRARLLKFHGCIVHATADPATFRPYLTGSHTQIMRWPEIQRFAAMRAAIVDLAANSRSLVLGLSIQDSNLQTIFIRAQEMHPWHWPCAPAASAQVFCEESIKPGQRDVLRSIYVDAYDHDAHGIETASHLRAWAEQTLIALVLKTLADKLSGLMQLALDDEGKAGFGATLKACLDHLRELAGGLATFDPADESRTPAVNQGISIWSRLVHLFRNGCLQRDPLAYEPISAMPPAMLAVDQNARAAGLGRLGVALSLLEHGRSAGIWSLARPANDDLGSGAATALPSRTGATPRPVFIVKSATEAIALKTRGAFDNDNAVVIHGDDAWHRMVSSSARRPGGAPGRTGRVQTTHVSLGDLLARSATVNELQSLFATEMLL